MVQNLFIDFVTITRLLLPLQEKGLTFLTLLLQYNHNVRLHSINNQTL